MAKDSSSSPGPFIPHGSEHEYSEIKTSEEEEEAFLATSPLSWPRPKSRVRTFINFGSKVVVAALALYGLVDLGMSAVARVRTSFPRPCHCGSSIAEAVSMGCKYDSLATSWLPDHCRDDEMTALFEQTGPGPNGEWNYYASSTNLTKKYTLQELPQLADLPHEQRQVFATTAWHDKHCFFTLLKQARGKAKMQYTGFPSALHHAVHCGMEMAKRRPWNQVIVSTSPGFGDPNPEELEELTKMEMMGMEKNGT